MSAEETKRPAFRSWRSYSEFSCRVKNSSRYIWGEEDEEFLRTVLATISDRDGLLKTGQILYRAQRGVEWIERKDSSGTEIAQDVYGYSSERMKPLRDRAQQGRANSTGIPALYVANTIETAISEVRPWVGAEVSVATCKVSRPLRTLDLSVTHGKSAFSAFPFYKLFNERELTSDEIEQAVWTDIDNAFSRPVTQSDDRADYVPTQILAELFRGAGYDAIGYKSHFGDSKSKKGYNIVVFDLDAVEVIKCEPYEVSSIKVDAVPIGNPWFKSAD